MLQDGNLRRLRPRVTHPHVRNPLVPVQSPATDRAPSAYLQEYIVGIAAIVCSATFFVGGLFIILFSSAAPLTEYTVRYILYNFGILTKIDCFSTRRS